MAKRKIEDRPFQTSFIDFLGPYPRFKIGCTSLLVVLDAFSKFVFIKPLRKANTKNLIEYLVDSVFCTFGVPEVVFSDNGCQFTSKEFANLLEAYGIKHVRTAIHSPQANQSERVNGSIIAAIRSYINSEQRDWDVNIPHIAAALRNTVHEATNTTPYFLLFGQHMQTHGSNYALLRKLNELEEGDSEIIPPEDFLKQIREQVKKNLKKAPEKGRKVYDRKCKLNSFQPGQEVYRRNFCQSDFAKGFNAKLAKKFIKCRVVKKHGSHLYELEDLTGKRIKNYYHAKDLKI